MAEVKKKNYQTDFALRTDLYQKEVYAYETAVRVFDKDAPTVDNIVNRVFQVLRASGFTVITNVDAEHYLKAAIQAEWIASPECSVLVEEKTRVKKYMIGGEDVDKIHPGKVRWYGIKINEKHTELITPPDPNL